MKEGHYLWKTIIFFTLAWVLILCDFLAGLCEFLIDTVDFVVCHKINSPFFSGLLTSSSARSL